MRKDRHTSTCSRQSCIFPTCCCHSAEMRLLHSAVRTSQIPVKRKFVCSSTSVNIPPERLLFHTFTILPVMFGDTSKYILTECRGCLRRQFEKFLNFRTWSASVQLLQGTPPAKAFRFRLYFLWLYFHERKWRRGHWQDFVNGTGGFACVLLLYVRVTVNFWQKQTFSWFPISFQNNHFRSAYSSFL